MTRRFVVWKFFVLLLLFVFVGGNGCFWGVELPCATSNCLPSCSTNKECNSGEYCHSVEGVCGETRGTCKALPTSCTQNINPVCGCDGKTYNNACEASSQGVSVAKLGPCGVSTCQYNGKTYKEGDSFPSSDGCNSCSCKSGGGVGCTTKACLDSCSTNQECNSGEYCHSVEGVCGKNQGTCKTFPTSCTQNINPVCGCDGKTYNNECVASSQGVSVAKQGQCGVSTCQYNGKTYKEGDSFPSIDGCNSCFCENGGVGCTTKACDKERLCGATFEDICNKGEYCHSVEGVCGETRGTCKTLPTSCAQNINPVCGCDGKTYNNACEASSQGVSVAKQGFCENGGVGCTKRACLDSCLTNQDCSKGEYCQFKEGVCGKTKGVCASIPTACTSESKPVVGCDGKTYDNECVAASNSTSIHGYLQPVP